MIGIVDYEAGNIASVAHALDQITAPYRVSADPGELASCDGVLLPGVGAAPGALESLRKRGLVDFLRGTDAPLLGICLGMQLLFDRSAEGGGDALARVPGEILRFDSQAQKVPHMGWNEIETLREDPLFEGTGGAQFFYFAHSYYLPPGPSTLAICRAGVEFSAVIRSRNSWGVQFHPEKSGPSGLKILKNFEAICLSSRR